jgi:hypothetical protein
MGQKGCPVDEIRRIICNAIIVKGTIILSAHLLSKSWHVVRTSENTIYVPQLRGKKKKRFIQEEFLLVTSPLCNTTAAIF